MVKRNKVAKVTEQVEKGKKKQEFDDDINSYFQERDKNNRGSDGKSEDLNKENAAETEVRQILYNESLKTIPVPKTFGLMFSSVLLTARRNKVTTESGIVIAQEGYDIDCDYQEVQEIVAIGPQIKNDKDGVRLGWEVAINFENFRSFRAEESGSMADKVNKTKELKIPIITINNIDYILIGDRDIKYIPNNKN